VHVCLSKNMYSFKHISIPISYLNVFEENDYMVEKKFFEANPNKGKLYNKIISKRMHTHSYTNHIHSNIVGSLLTPPQNDLTLVKVLRTQNIVIP